MKFRLTLFFVLFCLLLPAPLLAQEGGGETAVDLLNVELWPDYDRESMLVLLTGVLPTVTTFPVTLTIPMPDDATLNAVARITPENQMIDDVEFSESGDAVTFTLSEARFRVEYYVPYEADGLNRAYTFNWNAGFPVGQLLVTVQEPAAAASIAVDPAAEAVTTGSNDGLTYHNLPATAVDANETYTASVNYTLSSPQLTVAALQQQPPAAQPAPTVQADEGGITFDWPLLLVILGGVIIIGVIVWQLVAPSQSRRTPRKPKVRRSKTTTQRPKPQPAPPPAQKQTAATASKFCHECGTALAADDKFCRNCGTAVK